jgi:hypothetical protein
MKSVHIVFAVPLFAAGLFVFGCNGLTGIGDLKIVNDEGQGGAGGDGSGNTSGHGSVGHTTAAGSGGTSGSGSPSGSGVTAGVTSGSGATSGATTGPSTSAATTSVSTSAASGGGNCVYPGGPNGVSQGSIADGSLTWQGYADGANQLSTVTIKDYFDCDGSKGINALLVLTSASWCGACQQEAQEMPATIASWAGMGIKVLTLMIEDDNSNPATPPVALAWKNQFGLSNAVVADPDFSFAPPGSVGLPLNVIIDPRTMKIVDTEEGYSGDYTTLTQLAQKNK